MAITVATYTEATAPAAEFEDVNANVSDNLNDALAELRSAAPELLQGHVDHIATHIQLIQNTKKAKAYAHNFNNSKRAIKAALNSLSAELNAGHRHDKRVLSHALVGGSSIIKRADAKGRSVVKGYKHRACPVKRAEEKANSQKLAAKAALLRVGKGKVCNIGTTWGDMDIDKSRPKFGRALRNAWDKARSRWLKAKAKYNAAVNAHKRAIAAHQKAMAAFRTALNLEASNSYNSCINANREYQQLKRDVASNVKTRKQTFIATLVITCYINNLTSNRAAKHCADSKRRSSTSRWNIHARNLPKCRAKATLRSSYGPENWQPTTGACKGAPKAKKKIVKRRL